MIASVIFATGLLLGLLHALEPDHVAAVTTFAVRRPNRRAAVGFGLRWALGHGGMVLLVGTGLLLLGLQFPPAAGTWLERLVGLVLVGLGAWTVASARRLHVHAHTHPDGVTHTHLHSHAHGAAHAHGHGATLVGALHGLAGTAPVIALLPVVALETPWLGIGYLIAFGIGTAIAMGLYALLAGAVVGGAARRSGRLARRIAMGTGVLTIAVGLFWLVQA
jgi:ABC-type nickel/cobalt efflux system permease component RcnA